MSTPARIVDLEARPDLVDAMWDMPDEWPEFMKQDPIGDLFFGRLPEVFPAYQLLALDEDDRVLGKVNSLPFVWDGTDEDLPDRGWDAVQERGFADERLGRTPTAVSLLEARVVPDRLGTGFSSVLLRAARERTAARGLQLLGPVRPTQKHREPRTPMAEYAFRTRPDGLPADPWLRTHARLGARTVKVCPAAMVVPGTLADWRGWTGMPFDTSGSVEVPGALVPVHVSVEQDAAVYVEPNVWVHHAL